MTVRISPIFGGVGEPLAVLHAACFPDEPWDAGALERILALPGGFAFCACQADSLVGFVLVRDLGGECEILSIGVAPESRRRGIGRVLLDAVFVEAGRRGSDSVVLEVACDNDPARRLYATFGFVAVGRRPRYYSRASGRADALILRRMTRAEAHNPGT